MKSNLKRLRKEAGLTLQDLGDIANVSRQRIFQLESDDANPTLKSAYKISKILAERVEDIWPNDVALEEEIIDGKLRYRLT